MSGRDTAGAGTNTLSDGDQKYLTAFFTESKKYEYRIKGIIPPLHLAAFAGDPRVTSILLERGDDVNVKDALKSTPLHIACQEGKIEAAELLLSNKLIQINAQSDTGATPFLLACGHGKADITAILEQAKADVTLTLRDGLGPLHLTSLIGDVPTLRTLLSFPKVKEQLNAVDAGNRTALYGAALKGHAEIVKILLAAGADPNIPETESRFTPLHIACWNKDHTEAVKALLASPKTNINATAGAFTPEFKGKDGPEKISMHAATPLDMACIRGSFASAESLNKRQAKTRATMGPDNKPFQEFAKEKGWNRIGRLLQSAIDAEACTATASAGTPGAGAGSAGAGSAGAGSAGAGSATASASAREPGAGATTGTVPALPTAEQDTLEAKLTKLCNLIPGKILDTDTDYKKLVSDLFLTGLYSRAMGAPPVLINLCLERLTNCLSFLADPMHYAAKIMVLNLILGKTPRETFQTDSLPTLLAIAGFRGQIIPLWTALKALNSTTIHPDILPRGLESAAPAGAGAGAGSSAKPAASVSRAPVEQKSGAKGKRTSTAPQKAAPTPEAIAAARKAETELLAEEEEKEKEAAATAAKKEEEPAEKPVEATPTGHAASTSDLEKPASAPLGKPSAAASGSSSTPAPTYAAVAATPATTATKGTKGTQPPRRPASTSVRAAAAMTRETARSILSAPKPDEAYELIQQLRDSEDNCASLTQALEQANTQIAALKIKLEEAIAVSQKTIRRLESQLAASQAAAEQAKQAAAKAAQTGRDQQAAAIEQLRKSGAEKEARAAQQISKLSAEIAELRQKLIPKETVSVAAQTSPVREPTGPRPDVESLKAALKDLEAALASKEAENLDLKKQAQQQYLSRLTEKTALNQAHERAMQTLTAELKAVQEELKTSKAKLSEITQVLAINNGLRKDEVSARSQSLVKVIEERNGIIETHLTRIRELETMVKKAKDAPAHDDETLKRAYAAGHAEGYAAGHAEGYAAGHAAGHAEGYAAGVAAGSARTAIAMAQQRPAVPFYEAHSPAGGGAGPRPGSGPRPGPRHGAGASAGGGTGAASGRVDGPK